MNTIATSAMGRNNVERVANPFHTDFKFGNRFGQKHKTGSGRSRDARTLAAMLN